MNEIDRCVRLLFRSSAISRWRWCFISHSALTLFDFFIFKVKTGVVRVRLAASYRCKGSCLYIAIAFHFWRLIIAPTIMLWSSLLLLTRSLRKLFLLLLLWRSNFSWPRSIWMRLVLVLIRMLLLLMLLRHLVGFWLTTNLWWTSHSIRRRTPHHTSRLGLLKSHLASSICSVSFLWLILWGRHWHRPLHHDIGRHWHRPLHHDIGRHRHPWLLNTVRRWDKRLWNLHPLSERIATVLVTHYSLFFSILFLLYF